MDFNLAIRNKENLILLRPGISDSDKYLLKQYIRKSGVRNSLFLASSGTTAKNEVKVFEISHDMMLGHAERICDQFHLDEKVNYINCLPVHFMGGISILYRKYITGFNLISHDHWDVHKFIEASRLGDGNYWSSLVPTQLEDIYKNGYKLSHFNGVFIGGDRLSQTQYQIGIDQSDPLYETYGASEFCSQIATSLIKKENRYIDLLPFSNVKCIKNQSYVNSEFHFHKIHILKGGSLKSIFYESNMTKYGYPINDKIEIKDKGIRVLGRTDDFIKINGKFISVLSVQNLLSKKLNLNESDFFLTVSDHSRHGSQIHLMTTKKVSLVDVKDVYSKISSVNQVDHFLYSHSGKLIKNIKAYTKRGIL